MDDLVAFVRRCVDQDERDATDQKQFDAEMDRQRGNRVDAILIPPLAQLGSLGDPDRVLAEVEAKRELLDSFASDLADDPTDETAQWRTRLLAQPYAGRAGWRDEWRIAEHSPQT